MEKSPSLPLMLRIERRRDRLTPKGRVLADFIRTQPRKAVFMTTRELAGACGVSEATVVRFVARLGFAGYGDFIQALRDQVDTDLTLLDRVDLTDLKGPGAERFGRIVREEIDNLQRLCETADLEAIARAVDALHAAETVFVVGSRISYTLAYYLGWSLTKLRGGVQILKGSDRTCVDWLTIAPARSLVVVVAVSRYPTELIRIGKLARRLGHGSILLTDSAMCPLAQFAEQTLVAPSRHIPFIGSPGPLACLINYMVQELAGRCGEALQRHQSRLERAYWENDILFNFHPVDPAAGV